MNATTLSPVASLNPCRYRGDSPSAGHARLTPSVPRASSPLMVCTFIVTLACTDLSRAQVPFLRHNASGAGSAVVLVDGAEPSVSFDSTVDYSDPQMAYWASYAAPDGSTASVGASSVVTLLGTGLTASTNLTAAYSPSGQQPPGASVYAYLISLVEFTMPAPEIVLRYAFEIRQTSAFVTTATVIIVDATDSRVLLTIVGASTDFSGLFAATPQHVIRLQIEATASGTAAPGLEDDQVSGFSFHASFVHSDCNHNGVDDARDLLNGTSADCDGNNVPDECDPDCNGSGIPDPCDIAQGLSTDCNANGIPDECEPDCNGSGLPDSCDIAQGLSADCNANGIPDECDIAARPALDCNRNLTPDECDIASGASADQNENGFPDECEYVWHVSAAAPPGGDGRTWSTAVNNLQFALDVAEVSRGAIAEVWVAAGTYRPSKRTDPNDPRSATFRLVDGLALYGGFAGTEASVDERDINANPTILSGDFNGDDKPDFVNYDENAYHVVTGIGVGPATIVDGFTITGGHSPGVGFIGSYGGGMHLVNSSPDIRNCTFTRNLAERPVANVACSGGGGAALYLRQEAQDPGPPPLTVSRSHFTDNKSIGDGGAVFFYGYSSTGSIIFSECSFERNVGLGAFTAYAGGTQTFRSCTFSDNSGGGAISASGNSDELLIEQCRFEHNSAGLAGAVYLSSIRRAAIHGSVFVDNSAYSWGSGALRLYDVDEIDLIDCEFRGNSAGTGGGAYLAGYTSIAVKRCLFVNNSANNGIAGGLYVDGPASLVDCTFLNNYARDSGGGLFVDGSAEITGCTIKNNRSSGGGGGALASGMVSFADTVFNRNWAEYGGAIHISAGSQARLDRCRVEDNGALVGGGLATTESSADVMLVSSLIASNQADAYGGGVAAGNGTLTVQNCTIANNTAGALGAGMIVGHDTSVMNSIVWGNVVDPRGGVWTDEVAQIEGIEFATIDYSDVQGWSGTYGGDGNIGLDPLFVAPTDPDGPYGPMEPDFHLRPESPCINAGLTEAVDPGPWDPPPPNLDLDGKPRVLCGAVDMGAYEYGLAGDVDCDSRVDLHDFSLWPQCAFGPGAPGLCPAFDADGDGDIDLRDAAALFRAFSPTSP